MSKLVLCVMFLFAAFAIQQADAQQLITDRPTQSVSTTIVPKGLLQLETGMAFEADDFFRRIVLQKSLFRYGVSDKMEFRLTNALVNWKPRISQTSGTTGIADTQFGLKYQFSNQGLRSAYVGTLVIPNGNKPLTRNTMGMSHLLLLEQGLSESIGLGLNLGFEHFDSEQYAGLYSLVMSFSLTKHIGFYSEVYGQWPKFDEITVLIDYGFTWLIHPRMQFDFSLGTGISDRSNYYALGFSWLMPGEIDE